MRVVLSIVLTVCMVGCIPGKKSSPDKAAVVQTDNELSDAPDVLPVVPVSVSEQDILDDEENEVKLVPKNGELTNDYKKLIDSLFCFPFSAKK